MLFKVFKKSVWKRWVYIFLVRDSEAALQRYSKEKAMWKYTAKLQENTQAEVWFQ